MKRALLLLVALAAIVVAMLATCDDRPATQSDSAAAVTPDAAVTKPVRRPRADAPLEETKPEETATPAPSTAPSHEATTTFTPPDAKVAAPRHVLRGRVVNRRGEPVADAEVSLFSMWLPNEVAEHTDENWPSHARSEMTTGADGTFAMPYFEGGPRALLVTWRVHRRRQCQGVSDDRFHEIVIDEATTKFFVHVTRADDGSPVTDAAVRVLFPVTPDVPPMKCPGGFLQPDDRMVSPGLWRILGGPEGPAILTVAAPGLAPETDRHIDVTLDREVTIEVVLKPGASVRGIVVDAVTGAPIAGAKVQRPQSWYAERIETETEADGRFVLEHVPLEPHTFHRFRAAAEGYATTDFLAGRLDASATECEATVRLQRAAKCSVRCIDGEGRPLAAAIVAVMSDYDATPPKGVRTWETCTVAATTGAEGRATIEGLHPGTEGIELRTRFYVEGVPVLERTFPPLAAGETRDLGDVVLAPTLALRGSVVDADGKPVAGATVVAVMSDIEDTEHFAIGAAVMERGGRRAETGPDGAFTLMGLSKGLWDVYASPDFIAPGRLETGVDPRVGTITLHLPRIVALEGRVVDAKGAAVARALVAASPPFFGMRTTTQMSTNEEGRFHLPGFAADAIDVEITVTPPNDAPDQTFKARAGTPSTELRLR